MAAAMLAGCPLPFGRPAATLPQDAQIDEPVIVSRVTPAPASGTPTPAVGVPALAVGIHGQILDESGQPRAGVRIGIFLADSTPPGVVTATASPAAYRIQDESGAAETDADGRFLVVPPEPGTYNVEAVAAEDIKAFQGGVTYNSGFAVGVPPLGLRPTGTIEGEVRANNTTDYTGTFVYIPGTSYLAAAAPNGSYRMTGVPQYNGYELAAFNPELGDARIPNPDNPKPLRVNAALVVRAPALALRAQSPEIQSVAFAGTATETDNAAPGTALELRGRFFGFNRNLSFQVTFGGRAAIAPERPSDGLIRLTVPPGAGNGHINISVGRRYGNSTFVFRVIKLLALDCGQVPFMLVASQRDFAQILTVQDDEAEAVPNYAKSLTWAVDSAAATVSPTGVVKAGTVAGNVTVTVSAGSLPARSCGVNILTATPTPGPSATPTAAPGASPTPSAKPSPTPTPVPTPTPSPAPDLVVTGVSVDPTAVKINAVPPAGDPGPTFNTTATLKATVKASGGNRGVSWSSSNAKVTVIDGVVSTLAGVSPGSYEVRATAIDDPTKFATASVTVTNDSGLAVEIK
jgi:hypothetical protein